MRRTLDAASSVARFDADAAPAAEIERTVSLAALPSDVRAVVTRVGEGAERIVCEHVLRIGGGRYEITLFRGGARIKLEI